MAPERRAKSATRAICPGWENEEDGSLLVPVRPLLGQKFRQQFPGIRQLPRIGLVSNSDHRIGQQILALGVRLSRRMKEIQEHVSQRRDLGQQELGRVCRTLPRGF
ncbi:hypothetical protein ACP_0657 [Acidobacterium capsulatum ATCC 51196]|uniref:Uncharacterized protein n=1 Tax=Acidobacterium capsulatum (strain ATCC 51196 / DSM 11244 / BCRC 80197 / JCM 7670 / NBRC 15755 / NCIMB 13165 / 161) TaxID=240015 RepID=C1F1Q1_ACIC5|nr:hypothetical protein ACP_0657 [Acidobacterium capsulatum ATCC 51196]